MVELPNGENGSLTIGGTVSPAGGNFEEPVTQSTLKVVGAFLGLSNDRANARRYPAIHPLESWSKYPSAIPQQLIEETRDILLRSNEVQQMMMVVGEEGTSLNDFEIYLKGEFLDSVYLQQNAFDEVDAATSPKRQKYIFHKVHEILKSDFVFEDKAKSRDFFYRLRQLFIDWNYTPMDGEGFKQQEEKIDKLIEEFKKNDDLAIG